MVGANSTAALMTEGVLRSAVSEERFVRVKNSSLFPENAIAYCLEEAGLQSKEIDCVVFDSINFNYPSWVVDRYGSFSIQDWIREQNHYWKEKIYEGKEIDFFEVFRNKIIPDHYAAKMRVDNRQDGSDIRIDLLHKRFPNLSDICYSVHYEAHHYYGYYASPHRGGEILSFTIEGFGDNTNATVGMFRDGQFEHLFSTDLCNIGRLYRYITLLLGMKPNEHEYKVMGLAAYSQNTQEVLNVLDETMVVDELTFKYKVKPTDHYFWFRDRFEGFRFDDIAAGVQTYIERLIGQWVSNWIQETRVDRVVFSGGVAMNIKAMMHVAKTAEVSDIFVPGTASDESTAIGACYREHVRRNTTTAEDRNDVPTLNSLYLGPTIKHVEINKALEKYKIDESQILREVSNNQVAELLSKGHIIARCVGRMEFGARALGNRSILCDPRDLSLVRKINRQIKNRDFWMPFSPVIIKELEEAYLLNPKNIKSPHMTIGFETTDLGKHDLLGALHQADLTARPQVLERETNPTFYGLIEQFYRLTGVGGLLNTSFNLHGFPIVCNADDALYVFSESGLEYLLLDNLLIQKSSLID
jgi:carbamoyltransferase